MIVAKTLLALVFLGSLAKGLELLLRRHSVDRLLLEHVGLGWLWQYLLYGMEVLQVAALLWLWRPYPHGAIFALGAVGLNLAATLLVVWVGLRHPSALQRAMVASRETRGLPVREGALALAVHPVGQAFQLLLPLVGLPGLRERSAPLVDVRLPPVCDMCHGCGGFDLCHGLCQYGQSL